MNEWKQIVLGTAVAAVLIMPGLAHAGQDRTWITRGQQSFNTHTLDLEHVIGDANIRVTDGGPMTVTIEGPRFLVDPMKTSANGDTLVVQGPHGVNTNFSVWDWTKWFDYSDVDTEKSKVRVTVSVPRGASVVINKQIGDVTLGDLDGHLSIEAVNSDVHAGRVADAKIKVVGGGDTSISEVSGSLSLDIAGSGDVKTGNVGSASIAVAGSGDTSIGVIRQGGLTANIAGSGDLNIVSVNGPVSLSIAGSGDVHIKDGKADPLKISMVGGGDVVFGGQAVNPTISAIGSGDVWLRSYTGNMSSSGMADVHVGGDNFPSIHMPAPPAPPAPSAPPAPPHH